MVRSYLSKYPFVRILLSWSIGILAGQYGSPNLASPYTIFGIALGLYCLLTLVKNRWPLSIFTGFVGLFAFATGGYVAMLQHSMLYTPVHIQQVAKDIVGYEAVVIEEVYYKNRYSYTVVKIESVCIKGVWKRVYGKLKLYQYGRRLRVKYGDVLVVSGCPEILQKNGNPYAVDHNAILHKKGIFLQHRPAKYTIIGHSTPSYISKFIKSARRWSTSHLGKYFQEEEEAKGVMLAMVLGVRSSLTADTREAYTNVGMMHILAISGLHVGLLYLLLLWLFHLLGSFLGYPGQYRVVSVSCLWLYAMLTGLSPSVMRAVGVLSLTVWARWWEKDYSLANLLAVVAFFMLLYNPLLLWDISFQLSFCAVSSILLFYKPIKEFIHFEFLYFDYFWQLIALSLAAQLGTLPLSIYYFHFFPTYFLVANALIMPLAGMLLSFGLLIIAFSWCAPLAGVLSSILAWLLLFIHGFFECLNRLPHAQLGPFFLEWWEVVAIYTWIAGIYMGIRKRSFYCLLVSTALLCGLSSTNVYREISQHSQEHILVYSMAPRCVVGCIHGKKATLLSDTVLSKHTWHYRQGVLPSLGHMGIEEISQLSWEATGRLKGNLGSKLYCRGGCVLLTCQGRKVMIITNACKKLPRWKKGLKVDVLIVEQTAIETLNDWLVAFEPTLLVIGATNNRLKTTLFTQQARQAGIDYYVVAEKGAWVL